MIYLLDYHIQKRQHQQRHRLTKIVFDPRDAQRNLTRMTLWIIINYCIDNSLSFFSYLISIFDSSYTGNYVSVHFFILFSKTLWVTSIGLNVFIYTKFNRKFRQILRTKLFKLKKLTCKKPKSRRIEILH